MAQIREVVGDVACFDKSPVDSQLCLSYLRSVLVLRVPFRLAPPIELSPVSSDLLLPLSFRVMADSRLFRAALACALLVLDFLTNYDGDCGSGFCGLSNVDCGGGNKVLFAGFLHSSALGHERLDNGHLSHNFDFRLAEELRVVEELEQ